MNRLIEKLTPKLTKYNLGIVVKKETITLLHCYLYDLDDCETNGIIFNYTRCKKLDITYKKTDLVKIIENNSLDSFIKRERDNYDMANKLNLLRR